MTLLDKAVDWLFPHPIEGAESRDELREAMDLDAENKRHVAFIERHVEGVSARVRDDFEEAEAHLPPRRQR